MNKIIFLDIDGVLNVYCESRDEFGCTFHKHFEDNLKYIIEQTNAKIVISSTWRMSGLSEMENMWKFRNLPGEIIGITPHIDICKRGQEIQWWLDNTTDIIDNYVIIDDDIDMLDSQLNNFVQTSNNKDHPDCIDIGYGLTKICAQKAIDILNNKKYWCDGCEGYVKYSDNTVGVKLCNECYSKYDNKTGYCSLSCCLGNGCDGVC